jgi:hypothetical protein
MRKYAIGNHLPERPLEFVRPVTLQTIFPDKKLGGKDFPYHSSNLVNPIINWTNTIKPYATIPASQINFPHKVVTHCGIATSLPFSLPSAWPAEVNAGSRELASPAPGRSNEHPRRIITT